MKKMILTIVTLVGFTLTASAAGFPDRLPIGKTGVVDILVEAAEAEITCYADSATGGAFVDTVSIPEFDDIEEIEQVLNPAQVHLPMTNVKDTITLKATLEDEDGNELFEAQQSIRWEKNGYDEHGRPKYELPWWAGHLYFQPESISVPFVGIESATLVGFRGESIDLQTGDNRLYIPGWVQYGQYSHLVVETIGGTLYYDFITGMSMPAVVAQYRSGQVNIDNIHRYNDDDGEINLELNPQWGNNPWVQVVVDNELELYVENNWGAEPQTVWVTTWEDVRNKVPAQKFEYEYGMEVEFIEPGTKLIWFEWNENMIRHSHHYAGGKG